MLRLDAMKLAIAHIRNFRRLVAIGDVDAGGVEPDADTIFRQVEFCVVEFCLHDVVHRFTGATPGMSWRTMSRASDALPSGK